MHIYSLLYFPGATIFSLMSHYCTSPPTGQIFYSLESPDFYFPNPKHYTSPRKQQHLPANDPPGEHPVPHQIIRQFLTND